MSGCNELRKELEDLKNEKIKYTGWVSDIEHEMFEITKKINECAKNETGGKKRRSTKRYKKSKKQRRRLTRSKIRV